MEQEKKLTFVQFLNTQRWHYSYWLKMSPWTTVSKVVTSIFTSLEPLVYTYIFAKILDTAIDIAKTTANPRDIVPTLGFLFMYTIIASVVSFADNYFSMKLHYLNMLRSPYFLYRRIHSLGVQTIEDPDVVNKTQRAREVIMGLSNDLEQSIMFLSRFVTLIVAAVVIIKIMPIFTIIIFVMVIPNIISNWYFTRKDWELWRKETENKRRAMVVYSTLIESSNLHEISVTSAYGYLSSIYRSYADRYLTAVLKLIQKWRTLNFFSSALISGTSIVGYFLIFSDFFSKLITIGDVTFQIRALSIFIGNLTSTSSGYVGLQERSLKIGDVKGVFEMKPTIDDGAFELPKFETAPHISLKNVNFSYPRSEAMVIKNLNLEIKPGEKIAIVGENGAGKTTLVRILSRFYKVNDGAILVDGHNINDVKIESWYKNLGVLFQDYNTYSPLTLKENIHLGNSHEKLDEERMVEAANKANVNSFLSNFKNGFDQVLSEKFKGGTRPSTGQWQKIAIARFFYRKSPVVIFDEPTAAIDAVSESEIFGQIYDFFKGKTVIIISHRFSTVRNADKIYVLDKGEIIESGSHDELIALKGKYHHAFTIQAEGYQ